MLASILSALAGCAIFMLGMQLLSEGLEKSAGPGMKSIFKKVDKNPVINVGVGALFTAIIQSSAATTVMSVGFVNAGVMSLIQATYVVMGANIGTTITGVLVAFSAFDIMDYVAVLAFAGIILTFFKNDKCQKIGKVLGGFGFIFVGLSILSTALKGNAEMLDAFKTLFATIDFPLLLILVGALFTALIQSSSTATAVFITLVGSGALLLKDSLFLVLGSNIGTCITTFIASAGTSTNARRVAVIHLLFNLIGNIIFFILLSFLGNEIVALLESMVEVREMQLAWFHVFFNVITTLALLPFAHMLANISCKIIRDKKSEKDNLKNKFIDERLFATPALAVSQVKKEVDYMLSLSCENIKNAYEDFLAGTSNNKEKLEDNERIIDFTNNTVTRYLIKLSPLVDVSDEKLLGSLFHVVNDVERIGDHAINFSEITKEMKGENLEFSSMAKEELSQMFNKVFEMFDTTKQIFIDKNTTLFNKISALEDEVDTIKDTLSASHVARLAEGNCKVELGAYFYSLVSGLERVADHLVNVSYSVLNPTGSQSVAIAEHKVQL